MSHTPVLLHFEVSSSKALRTVRRVLTQPSPPSTSGRLSSTTAETWQHNNGPPSLPSAPIDPVLRGPAWPEIWLAFVAPKGGTRHHCLSVPGILSPASHVLSSFLFSGPVPFNICVIPRAWPIPLPQLSLLRPHPDTYENHSPAASKLSLIAPH